MEITLQDIIDLRGGLPECCDFCQKPYTENRTPVPEEAGQWACIECWDRWEADDAARSKQEKRDE